MEMLNRTPQPFRNLSCISRTRGSASLPRYARLSPVGTRCRASDWHRVRHGMATALLGALFFLQTFCVDAAEFTIKTAETPVPKELGESIRAVLEPKTIQLLQDGNPVVEIWLRRDVPLKNTAAKLD